MSNKGPLNLFRAEILKASSSFLVPFNFFRAEIVKASSSFLRFFSFFPIEAVLVASTTTHSSSSTSPIGKSSISARSSSSFLPTAARSSVSLFAAKRFSLLSLQLRQFPPLSS
jgi:hypothetical protein